MPSASKRLSAPADETTCSSIMIDPMSLAPLWSAACAVWRPTVSHDACMLGMLFRISRLILNNIPNIQASWLTVGRQTAQAALHSGANDMGSIMIEEHVVSSAGADNRFDAEGIQQAIREAGFTPRLRNQLYELRPWPLDDTLR